MEKINLVELLKDCPKGMELDCTMYDNCTFDEIDDVGYIEILVKTPSGRIRLTKEGCFVHRDEHAKCVIFPKGKTTWEGFVPPCKFKDGDILATDIGSIFILKEPNEYVFYYGCYVALTDVSHIITSRIQFCAKSRCRLATEEEKQKLFDAIKANGCKWNPETKTLKKLTKPIFKVGNKVRNKNNHNIVFTITSLEEDYYACGAAKAFWFDDQDNYELVPNKFDIATLKPYDKVLVRDNDSQKWSAELFSFYDNDSEDYRFQIVGVVCARYCVPFVGNEHLLGTTDDCTDFYKTLE